MAAPKRKICRSILAGVWQIERWGLIALLGVLALYSNWLRMSTPPHLGGCWHATR